MYKAVKMSGLRSSDLMAILGAGGLGTWHCSTGSSRGARVLAVDLFHEKLAIFETVLNETKVLGSIVGTRTTCRRSSSRTQRARPRSSRAELA